MGFGSPKSGKPDEIGRYHMYDCIFRDYYCKSVLQIILLNLVSLHVSLKCMVNYTVLK